MFRPGWDARLDCCPDIHRKRGTNEFHLCGFLCKIKGFSEIIYRIAKIKIVPIFAAALKAKIVKGYNSGFVNHHSGFDSRSWLSSVFVYL